MSSLGSKLLKGRYAGDSRGEYDRGSKSRDALGLWTKAHVEISPQGRISLHKDDRWYIGVYIGRLFFWKPPYEAESLRKSQYFASTLKLIKLLHVFGLGGGTHANS